jgi:hypothetical protein
MNASSLNHIRLGLVLRNEYPAWYFYREKSRVIRSILVPQERLAEAAFAKHPLGGQAVTSRGSNMRALRPSRSILVGQVAIGCVGMGVVVFLPVKCYTLAGVHNLLSHH